MNTRSQRERLYLGSSLRLLYNAEHPYRCLQRRLLYLYNYLLTPALRANETLPMSSYREACAAGKVTRAAGYSSLRLLPI
jgi:hypothetical protein